MLQESSSKRAFDHYLALPSFERMIVETLALSCSELHWSQLQHLVTSVWYELRKLAQVGPKQNPQPNVQSLIVKLKSQGIMTSSYSQFHIDAGLRSKIFAELAKVPDQLLGCLQIVQEWRKHHHSMNRDHEELLTEVLAFYYLNRQKEFIALMESIWRGNQLSFSGRFNLLRLFPDYFTDYPFAEYPAEFQVDVFSTCCVDGLLSSALDRRFIDRLDSSLEAQLAQEKNATLAYDYRYLKAPFYFFQGDLKTLRSLFDPASDHYLDLIMGASYHLLNNEPEHKQRVLVPFDSALGQVRKITKNRAYTLPDLYSLIYLLALIKNADKEQLAQARKYKKQFIKAHPQFVNFDLPFERLLDALEKNASGWGHAPLSKDDSPITIAFQVLSEYLGNKNLHPVMNANLHVCLKKAAQWHNPYLARQLALFGAALAPNEKWPVIETSADAPDWLTIFLRKEHWQRVLELLSELKGEPEKKSNQELRVAWHVLFDSWSDQLLAYVKEQKKNAKGEWGKGKKLSLKKLYEDRSELTYLSAEDQALIDCIQVDYTGSVLAREKALPLLLNLPCLFDYYSGEPIELQKGEVSLQVKQGKNGMALTLVPKPDNDTECWQVHKKGAGRFELVYYERKQLELYRLIGNDLTIPEQALPQLTQTLADVSHIVPIHTNIKGISAHSDSEEVASDSSLIVVLRPHEQGLRLDLVIRPLGETGPEFPPGSGSRTIMASVSNDAMPGKTEPNLKALAKKLHCERDLAQERKNLVQLKMLCPMLEHYQHDDAFIVDMPLDCLELVTELQQLKEPFKLLWPEGEKFKIRKPSTVSWQVNSKSDWFEVKADVIVDEQLTLSMKDLLQQSKGRVGRYLELNDGQFLALSQRFQKQFEALSQLGEAQGEGFRYHHLMSGLVDDFISDEDQLKTDRHWQQQIGKLKQLQQQEFPIPSTLQAELRDYQYHGVQWLARLAEWGVGACLADDMGLGKTIQALALLLMRAPKGPALVVAPTSVSLNWIEESLKFSPALNVKLLFDSSDRTVLIENVQPFDVIVCSYTLLQNHGELLEQVNWCTIILDEAQAIKNSQAKRSQAAMKLQGEFKMVTTGTPIENHLGELWNLFRFINPGLLGSHEKFTQKYANPIEREGDLECKQRLKRLLQPFILRRHKTQVLNELPAKTEQLLHVELSPEERAIYEALRQQALESMAKTAGQQGIASGQKHLQVLAELTKLRLACCHPQLVLPSSKVAGSKLKVFGHTIQELIDNKHKALVFSQFVGHLKILESYLQEHAISYQYLDGSTPTKERKKRLQAFQAGEGEVFLISLKAGGVGLNLTAADYVIHMDPWWNPAVEDQASDRAHRIGQLRPVTVYRLIAQNTIEEKIVKLHEHKRDLADSLLAGTDTGNKLSFNEIMEILKTQ